MDGSVQHIYNQIKELFAAHDWKGVIALSRQALQTDSENVYHLSNLAFALEHSHLTEEAISTWREVLRLYQRDASAYLRLGIDLASQGKQTEAKEAYEQSNTSASKNGDVLFRLGKIRANSGNFKEGLELFEQALQAGEDTVETYYGLGFCLERLHNLQLAADMYSICVQKCHYNAHALNALGRVLANLGKKEQAIAAWKRVLDLDNSDFVSRANQSLLLIQNDRWSNSES